MENIFVEFLPPWVETGLQPAFYDKESGTVLQQTARMYARVNMLIRMFNKLSKNTKEEIENYIEKFNQLHDYVEDYFDNLDVQEEINNKLDEMVEDGVLQEIIYQFLQSNVAWTFDTVADMKLSTNLINGSYARTLGYHSINDGGGAFYKITNTGTADEMYIVAVNNDLNAHLIIQDYITPEVLGAYGDGVHDDGTPLQECLNNTTYKHSVLSKVYHITSPVTVANNKIVDGGGTIDSTDGCIILDGSAHITIRDLYLVPTTYGIHLRTNNTWINYINFEDIDINGYTHSATHALYIEPTSYYINEVHYTNCKFKNCQYGVYAKNDTNKDMAQHQFINCSVEGSTSLGIYIKGGSYFNFITCRHTEGNSSKWKTEGTVNHLLILGGNVNANTSGTLDFSDSTQGAIIGGLRFAGIYANTPCTNAQIVNGVIIPDQGAIMHSRYNVTSDTTMSTTSNIYYMFNFNTDAEVTLTLPSELYGGQGKYNQFFVRVQANQTHNSIVKVGTYFTKTLASTGSIKYYRFDYSEFGGSAGWLVEAIDSV